MRTAMTDKRTMHFRVLQRRPLRGKRWFWHLRAGNARIVAQGDSSGYHNVQDALHAIDLLKNAEPVTEVRVMAPLPKLLRGKADA